VRKKKKESQALLISERDDSSLSWNVSGEEGDEKNRDQPVYHHSFNALTTTQAGEKETRYGKEETKVPQRGGE